MSNIYDLDILDAAEAAATYTIGRATKREAELAHLLGDLVIVTRKAFDALDRATAPAEPGPVDLTALLRRAV